MQVALGKNWSKISVRRVFEGQVVSLTQGDQDIVLPAAKVIALAAALRRTRARRKLVASRRRLVA